MWIDKLGKFVGTNDGDILYRFMDIFESYFKYLSDYVI
jgi:hypothetical protein